MGNRGVSPVVGMAILLGLTAIAAVSLLVVGGAMVEDVKSSAERDQAERSMESLAASASDAAEGGQSGGQFEFDGGRDGTTWVNESAGSVEVVLVNGSDETLITSGDLGVYKHELDDGTELAYQGGGVWRHEDGHAELVEPPALQFRESPEPTLTFPNVRIRGDVADTGEVSGELAVVEQEDKTANVSNPVVGDYVRLDVESEYCEGWQTHVRQRTDGAIEEGCAGGAETGPGALRVNMSVADSHVNTTEDTTEGDDDETDTKIVENGTYGLYAEDEVRIDGAGGTINGTIGAGENIDFSSATGYNHRGNLTENVTHERDPHDDEIADLVAEASPSDWEPLCAGNQWASQCEYAGNQTLYINDTVGGAEGVTFDVTDGNITLVVPGDLETNYLTNWTVEGHESSGNVVKVYVGGNVTFGGDVQMGTAPTAGPGSMPDPIGNPPENPNAEALQFLGSSDTDISIEGSFKVEAKISAPSPSDSDQSRAVAASSSTVTFVGALHAGTLDVSASSTDIYLDDGVATTSYEETEIENGTNSTTTTNTTTTNPDEDLYYLHVSETVLEVED